MRADGQLLFAAHQMSKKYSCYCTNFGAVVAVAKPVEEVEEVEVIEKSHS